MFLAYSKYPTVTDLRSGVQYLIANFIDLELEALNESTVGRYHSPEVCLQISENYGAARVLCRKFLDNEVTEINLAIGLMDLELNGWLHHVKRFLSKECLAMIVAYSCESDSSSSSNV